MSPLVLAALIFLAMYVLIVMEKFNRTIVALCAAMAMVVMGILNQHEAFAAIDFNTVFLLAGMMMVVTIMKRTGIFQYMAVRASKMAKGDPVLIMIFLAIMTAVISAFLDNVTTVLLVAPVSLAITDALGLHPVPFLLCEALASNIGGTATLIGDPPNIMIGSAAGLSFMDFAFNLTPVIVLVLIAFLLTVKFIFRRELYILPELREMILEFDERKALTDVKLLKKSLWVCAFILTGFLLHEQLKLEVATIALSGGVVLLLWSRIEPDEVFKELEWSTLFFFIGLFIAVAAITKVGLMDIAAEACLKVTRKDPVLTTMFILWFSAGAAAFVNNISFTATMIPLVKHIGTYISITPLWWALALGACLGGNGTLTGAAANLIVANISGREGYPITFKSFIRYGMPLMIESVLICTLYVYFRYLR